ncbi:hypothetical protein CASFOL_035302 [Castilleja foliolosa]|uniref:GRF-type domain-containing protein n=1 Tax=Castilleja foliolosa TaxID=1961234 RepID=A0ABD3BSG4_9LAMI
MSSRTAGSRSDGSSANRSSNPPENELVRCHCGIELELLTSLCDENPGRRFHACPNLTSPSSCGFFRWYDGELCARSKAVIPGLLRKTEKLEFQLVNDTTQFVKHLKERHTGVMDEHRTLMQKVKKVMEDEEVLTVKLQLCKKKERAFKILIAVMVLIIAFQALVQHVCEKTVPRQLM